MELLGYFTGEFPRGHPYERVTATPGLGYQPVIWLLGSSDYSAQAAGMLGLEGMVTRRIFALVPRIGVPVALPMSR